MLEKRGSGPATYYVPTMKCLENWPPKPPGGQKPIELGGKSQEFDRKSQELQAKSQELDSKSQKLPPDLAEKIKAQGKKGSPEEILKLVVEILSIRALSAAELARYLDRNVEHVRRSYLKPLIVAGRILSSNPENPTDPSLKYFAVPAGDSGRQ